MKNLVGIDVSKGKSTVSIMRPFDEVLYAPFEIKHTIIDIEKLISIMKSIEGEIRIVMEHTGRYNEPLTHYLTNANFFVSAVNPQLIKKFDISKLRDIKNDKSDSLKISKYGLDKWTYLKQYCLMDELRTQLKLMNRQYGFYTKLKTAYKNNLISLLDQTFPGVNAFFTSPARSDGHQKWIDFAATYWHVDCVRKMSLNAFTEHYTKWCQRKKYDFSQDKAEQIYNTAKNLVCVLPKDELTKRIIKQAAEQLLSISKAVEELRIQMDETAQKLPEYPVVMAMRGVGTSLGPQLMAEIGDITRFDHKGALVAFAGVDPGVNQSGRYNQKSVHASKKGSPELRRTLYLIMEALIKTKPADDPVYQFIDKKRSQGKPYYVYMTAGCTKFLRLYYGQTKAYLLSQETNANTQ